MKSASPLDSFLAGVRRTVLPNGLTVITRETPGSGVVAVNTWVKAGYFNEPDEVAGMAHLFEHMFFKGSKQFPGAEQISEELSAAGGRSNAGTIYDTTNYWFYLPKENFRRALEIQADAIANPLFDAAELKKESEVVIEESNRKRDNPPAMAAELMYATAFTQHRMKRWRIGSNDVLRNIKRDNLLAFFETLYRPENMILVVAGDVTHAEALRAVNDTFGKLSKGKLDKKFGPAEPAQTEFRYGQSAADLRQSYSVIGFHTVGADHKDVVVLDVLASILGQGRTSRLYRNAVAPDAAGTATASHITFGDIGMFEVDASFDEKNRAEVDRRVLREIERIKTSGPTAFELQLAKNRLESGSVLGLESVLGQAQTLGELETRNGYRSLATDLQRVQALTAKDVTDAARRYLTLQNMTLYHYRPKGAPEMTREAALQFVQQAIGSVPPTAEADVAVSLKPAAVRPAAGATAPRELKLSNGATLIVEERPGAPIISSGIYFRRGRSDENSSNAGITQLMSRTMRRGTATRTAEQIDREIEFLGTQIGTTNDRDYFGFSVTSVARNFRPAATLISDVVLHPSFPEQRIVEEKSQQKSSIKRAYDSSLQRPLDMMYETFYRNHPYGLPAEGYASSLDAIDAAALRSWWQSHVVADDAVIVIVGDIAADDAKTIAEEAFGALPKRMQSVTASLQPVAPAARAEVAEFRDRKQSAIALAFPAVPMAHPDWIKLRMIQELSSGLSGTLFAELRGKRALAYTVSAAADPAAQTGVFFAYMASEAAKEEQAKRGLLEELRHLGGDAATEANVARTKSSLSGATRISQQTNSARAATLARYTILGLGLDFTQRYLAEAQKITVEELRATATKYFGNDNFVMAVVKGKP